MDPFALDKWDNCIATKPLSLKFKEYLVLANLTKKYHNKTSYLHMLLLAVLIKLT